MRYPKEAVFKKHGVQIMHYLLRNPCATAGEIILAVEGKHSTVHNRLIELEEEGRIWSFYSVKSNCNKYAIRDEEVPLALSFRTENLQW